MGIIVLIIAAAVEIAFGVYCITTESSQRRIRNYIRIGSLATLIILSVVSVIQWGFQWAPLTAVLLVWTIISAVSLIRKTEDKKEYMAGRIVFKGIATCLIIAIAITPALMFPQYKLPQTTGQYKVNTVDFTYTDDDRIETFQDTGAHRKVTVQFTYPENADGKYPLVVFSHGAFGIRNSNTSTYLELASNGYIVCSISHPYHSMYTKDTDGNLTLVDQSFIKEVTDVNNGVYDQEAVFQLTQKWLNVRAADINLVLNQIIEKANDHSSDQVYQLIDTDKIGLLGHSLGGAASALLGRERSDVTAVINLDGDLLGEELGIVDGKYVINQEIYPVPLLSIYTDTMKELFAKVDPELVLPQELILATAPNAHEIFISGTNHMSLTDLPLFSPFLVAMINGSIKNSGGGKAADKLQVIEEMNSTVLAFFKDRKSVV